MNKVIKFSKSMLPILVALFVWSLIQPQVNKVVDQVTGG